MKLTTRSPLLEFGPGHTELRDDLSVVALSDKYLWVASDETTSIERLATDDGQTFTNHKSFSLAGVINLPLDPAKEEIDVEGLVVQEKFLWIIGSHSVKRKKVEKDDKGSIKDKIEKLSRDERKSNRHILARIPIIKNPETGEPELIAPGGNSELRAAQLNGDEMTSDLIDAIKGKGDKPGDAHLSRFVSIPGKENGFDIEGLAIAGEKMFIGLRGPVLRGWAVILEVSIDDGDAGKLKLKNIGPGDRPYKKHFLQLEGLGIRELCVQDSDLLILAGPTMELDGPVHIFRWKDGVKDREESLVFNEELAKVIDVPFGQQKDHAEGIALVPGADPPAIMVVHDSPSDERKEGDTAVRADVFELPR